MFDEYTTQLLGLIGSLAAVTVIIAAAYFVTKWIAKRYGAVSASGRFMRVVDRIPLAQDKCLLLVEVSGKMLVIGMTAKGIDNLAELPADQLLPLTRVDDNMPEKTDFKSYFTKIMKKDRGDDPGDPGDGPS